MRLKTALMTAAALAAGAGLVARQRAKPQVAALPLEMGAAAPLGEAPPPGGLPPAPPARIATLTDYRDAYAYPDRAWRMSGAFGDSPPDYAFYDDGVTPWVWVADDDSECLAEPVPGGERYYYFEPGAYTPFYVQDPSYGYGFANGQLVAIYDRGGREVAPSADPTGAATAGQYLARGRLLRQAAGSQPHQAVAAANWSARRGLIAAEHASFARDAARDPAWTAYHSQHQAQDQARFAAEATRREGWAAQTDSRLGQSGRAEHEQQLAQSIAQGAAPMGGARMRGAQMARAEVTALAALHPPQRPGAALNRYAAAPPAPQRLAREGMSRAGIPNRQPEGVTRQAAAPAGRAQAERSREMARSASEHANDAAFQARGEDHAGPAAAHAFHAPAAPQASAHVAPAVHAAPPPPHPIAEAHPAPPTHAAPPAPHVGGNGETHH